MSHPFSPEELTAIRRADRAITDDAEIADLLRQADICRIATSVNDQPFISPNTFWYLTKLNVEFLAGFAKEFIREML